MSKTIPYVLYLRQLAHAERTMRREVEKTDRRMRKRGFKLVCVMMDERIYERQKD